MEGTRHGYHAARHHRTQTTLKGRCPPSQLFAHRNPRRRILKRGYSAVMQDSVAQVLRRGNADFTRQSIARISAILWGTPACLEETKTAEAKGRGYKRCSEIERLEYILKTKVDSKYTLLTYSEEKDDWKSPHTRKRYEKSATIYGNHSGTSLPYS